MLKNKLWYKSLHQTTKAAEQLGWRSSSGKGSRGWTCPGLWIWCEPTAAMEQFIREGTKTISQQEKRVFLLALVRRSELVRAWSWCSGQVLGILSSLWTHVVGETGSLGEHSAPCSTCPWERCLKIPLLNFCFSSILVVTWKNKIGGRDLMHNERVQFNGGNNLSNSQY